MRRIIALVIALCMGFPISVSANELPFTDVPTNYVWYDAIEYVYENGLMVGATETTFNPNGTLMRAMIVTILWRHAGEPVGYENPGFTDITTTDFYYDAVCWADELGITTGTTPTTFDPYRNVTLQVTIIFLYRYALHEDCGNMSYVLPDPLRMTNRIGTSGYYYTIAPVAYDAVNWALNCGVIADSLTYFNGTQLCTRSDCAYYLYKFFTLAFGDGRVFALTSFDIYGRRALEPVRTSMNHLGYDANIQFDIHEIAMKFALSNTSIIYVQVHGSNNGLQFTGNEIMNRSEITADSLQNVDLIYLCCCYAGGNFLQTMYHFGGVSAGVGFEDEIEMTTDSLGGVSYFDRQFFKYLSWEIYTLEECCERALEDMIRVYGETENGCYYGAESYVVYGDYPAV